MEEELKNSIVNNDLDQYKYYGKNQKIINELMNLQNLKKITRRYLSTFK